MTTYALSTVVADTCEATERRVVAVLADEGFGVLTRIDVAATLRSKLGVDTPAQVILGACRPELAHEALQTEPSIGLMLPCNVVVRALDESTTVVEAVDPHVMVAMTDNSDLQAIADDAAGRLAAALASLITHAK